MLAAKYMEPVVMVVAHRLIVHTELQIEACVVGLSIASSEILNSKGFIGACSLHNIFMQLLIVERYAWKS